MSPALVGSPFGSGRQDPGCRPFLPVHECVIILGWTLFPALLDYLIGLSWEKKEKWGKSF